MSSDQLKKKAGTTFKTPAGLSVLRKMLQGGSVEEIRARMTPNDLETLEKMRKTVSPDLKQDKEKNE